MYIIKTHEYAMHESYNHQQLDGEFATLEAAQEHLNKAGFRMHSDRLFFRNEDDFEATGTQANIVFKKIVICCDCEIMKTINDAIYHATAFPDTIIRINVWGEYVAKEVDSILSKYNFRYAICDKKSTSGELYVDKMNLQEQQ